MELGCSTAEPLQMVKASRQHTHRTTVSLKLSLLFGGKELLWIRPEGMALVSNQGRLVMVDLKNYLPSCNTRR